jgi:anti-sigma B factor antagonist
VTIEDLTNHRRAVITVTGGITKERHAQIEALIMKELDAGHTHLVFDLSDVDYISSSSLKMLVSLWKRIHDASGDMILAGLQPPVREVFALIGFDLVFTIFDSVDDVFTPS